ncbi:hypothetical protein Tco_0092146 [Tanacetum coccineum]
MTNDQANYYSKITSITVNGKNAYELKGKFLDDLHLVLDPDYPFTKNEGFKTYENLRTIDLRMDNVCAWGNTKNHGRIYGAWEKPTQVTRLLQPFNYKTRCSEWPTCGWREDGYCNRGNLPGAYIIGNSLHYQDYEWYKALKDGELKEEALRNKAIIEGTIDDDDEWIMKLMKERQEICSNETHELPICNIRRFEMIKYSFGDDKEYVAVKEDGYDDLTSTRKYACRAYQEIFHMMDEG